MISLIAFACAVMVFCLILLKLQPYGARYDHVHKRLHAIAAVTNKNTVLLQDEELKKPLSERIIKPMLKSLQGVFKKYIFVNAKQNSLEKSQKEERLKRMVFQAGLGITPEEYHVIQAVVLMVLAVVFFVAALVFHFGFFRRFIGFAAGRLRRLCGDAFFLGQPYYEKTPEMERQLPEVLDLLSVGVEAGLGFEQALLHVIQHFKGPLIDELTVTYREMTMGRTRQGALQLLGERCELEEIKNFVGVIIQATQLGISIKNVLRSQAVAMRVSRRNKIEERAQKISVKILHSDGAVYFSGHFYRAFGAGRRQCDGEFFMKKKRPLLTVSCNGQVLADQVSLANNFGKRLKGLLGKKTLAPQEGLLLTHCSSVHCFFMQIPIEVIYLSRDMTVLGMEMLKPWRVGKYYKHTAHVLELSCGTGMDKIAIGDTIKVTER